MKKKYPFVMRFYDKSKKDIETFLKQFQKNNPCVISFKENHSPTTSQTPFAAFMNMKEYYLYVKDYDTALQLQQNTQAMDAYKSFMKLKNDQFVAVTPGDNGWKV